MKYPFKLACAALATTLVTSCGILESNGGSSTSITPLITSSGLQTSSAGNSNKKSIKSSDSSGAAVRSGAVKQIFQTDRCNDLSRGGFIWFTDIVVLDDWLTPLGDDLATEVKSKVDFATQGALLLDYGVAATPGAGAQMLSEYLISNGQEAVVKISPGKKTGKKRVQMVTHPCALFTVPRIGYKTLVIQSEQGDLLTSFNNPR